MEKKKILKKKKDKVKDKDKEKSTDSGNMNNKDDENSINNIHKKKPSKIIMEDSDEENISVKKVSNISNGKNTNMTEDGTSSNNDSLYMNNKMFKEPLMERLKKRNGKINEMPGFQFTSFGKKVKREFDDLSDLEFDFSDKNKFF